MHGLCTRTDKPDRQAKQAVSTRLELGCADLCRPREQKIDLFTNQAMRRRGLAGARRLCVAGGVSGTSGATRCVVRR